MQIFQSIEACDCFELRRQFWSRRDCMDCKDRHSVVEDFQRERNRRTKRCALGEYAGTERMHIGWRSDAQRSEFHDPRADMEFSEEHSGPSRNRSADKRNAFDRSACERIAQVAPQSERTTHCDDFRHFWRDQFVDAQSIPDATAAGVDEAAVRPAILPDRSDRILFGRADIFLHKQ
jgi:hypothetical protein